MKKIIVLILSLNFFSTVRNEKDKIVKDDIFNLGNFINSIYVGTWISNLDNQADFIFSKSGLFEMKLDYDPNEKSKKLNFLFLFQQDQYIENNNIYIETELDLTDDKQTTITGYTTDTTVQEQKSIFTNEGKLNCKLKSEIKLADINGKPLPLNYDKISDMRISGTIISTDCNINFSFKTEPKYIKILNILLFTILSIFFLCLQIQPFYSAIRSNDVFLIRNIGPLTLLGSLIIDVIIVTINITFGMRIFIDFFEFLTVITLFFMVSIMIKIRFYLEFFEYEMIGRNLDDNQRSRAKLFFMLKFIAAIVFAIVVSNFFITYYYLFIIVFLFPIFQIFHNSFYVINKHCFYFKLHFIFVGSQLFYPIAMRCSFFTFFRLRPDFIYILILFTMFIFFMIIMFMQKLFGRNFFLPKCMIPNYFNYFNKLKNLEDATNQNCPICFCALNENPDDDSSEQLILKNYMKTPCEHLFHEKCLKLWMDQKLCCPYCRAKIPPY